MEDIKKTQRFLSFYLRVISAPFVCSVVKIIALSTFAKASADRSAWGVCFFNGISFGLLDYTDEPCNDEFFIASSRT